MNDAKLLPHKVRWDFSAFCDVWFLPKWVGKSSLLFFGLPENGNEAEKAMIT
ncbi:hypothetical protein N8E87_03875 [Avibacterium paragallinarum]|nr:hypothetical protein [Avibacterium paragallinarum]UXN37615.1 hypothetical protein N8E87_03875 [Avibacterium paragallinarum]